MMRITWLQIVGFLGGCWLLPTPAMGSHVDVETSTPLALRAKQIPSIVAPPRVSMFLQRTPNYPQLKRPSTSLSLHTALAVRGGASNAPVGDFLHAVDLFGTGVFAFSGALTAGKMGMDLLGMIIVATITSVGGGTIRDLLLDSGIVFWMRDPLYFEICAVVTIGTYFVWPTLEKKLGFQSSARWICVADALGLGAFAVLGTQKAADMNLRPIMWVVSGVLSATFGGIVRDVLCLQQPRAMYPQRSMYAAHPLLGSAVYAMLINSVKVPKEEAAFLSFLVTFVSRVLAFQSPRRLPHWT